MRTVRMLLASVRSFLLADPKGITARLAVLLGIAFSPLNSFSQIGGEFEFTSAVYPVSERDGQALITVTRTSQFGAVMVDVAVTNDTAFAGTNFTFAAPITLTFSNFQTSATFPIPLADNTTTNSNPSVEAIISLQNPRAVAGESPDVQPTLGAVTNATLTIFDDDKALQFTVEKTSYEVNEGGTVEVSVVLSAAPGDSAQEVAVDFEVVADPGIATRAGSEFASDSDFERQTGTLTFGAEDTAQTITINTLPDQLVEFNEDFYVRLTEARGRLVEEAPAEPPTDGGLGAEADGGGGTEIPFQLGSVSIARITILFNGDLTHPQPAGAVDRSFNPDDDQLSDPPFNRAPGANNTVFGVATQPDGKTIIVGDFTSVNAQSRNRIARLTTNGVVDVTFSPTGGANDFVNAVAVYTNGPSSGKILIGGGFTSVNGLARNGIARLNENGSLDNTFNPGTGANGPVYAIAIQRDGAVVIGGDFTTYNGVPRNRTARLLANGDVDLNFDPGLGADGPVYAVFAEATSPLVVTNSLTNGLVQPYPADIDAGGNSGFVTLQYNFFDETNDIVVRYEGAPLYSSGPTNHVIVTTNALGEFITNFIPTVVSFPFSGSSSTLQFIVNTLTNQGTNWTYTVSIQTDTSVGTIVGGDFTTFDGISHGRVARLMVDGSVDGSFGAGTGIGADGTVYSITRQSNGKAVIGGAFETFNSFESPGVARLNPDGSFDRDFVVGYGADDIVFAVAAQPDDTLLVGGTFEFFNLTRRLFLARLQKDGPLDTTFMDPSYNQFAGFPDPDGADPIGFVTSFATDVNGDVIVGGTFERVGGGTTRTDVRTRMNFARLHGAQTPGPGNITFAQQSFGGDENAGSLAFLASRTNGSLGAAATLLATSDGGAVDGLDYVGTNGMPILWDITGPLQSDGSIEDVVVPIDLIDDTIVEGDEHFNADLLIPVGLMTLGGEYIFPGVALGNTIQAKGVILENDVQPSVISFEQPEYDFNENDGTVTITVNRSGNTSRAVSVRYSAEGATATEGQDYARVSGTLPFSSGQTSKSFTVNLINDSIVEPDESLVLSIGNPSPGVQLGTNAVATLNIIDNDYAPGRVTLSATNYTVIEGDQALITVRRTGGNVGILQINYATVNRSATVPFDYTEASGTLLWNDQDSTPKTIAININEDGLVEGNKEFSLMLFNPLPSGGLGLRTNAVITIADNDSLGSFSFNAAEYLADENGTNVIVNVIRRGGSAETASVNYATTNDTAIAGEDYVAASGTLTFQVGETSKSFVVPLLDDTEVNLEKRIGLILSSPQPAGASLGVVTNAFIAIVDNESINIPAGSIETDFGTGTGANLPVHTVQVQPDGRILIGGDFTVVNQQVRTHLARLEPDGRLDTSFGANYEINDSVRDMDLQSDGRILIAGSFTEVDDRPRNYLARISAGGIVDSTFDVGAGADNPIFAVESVEIDGEQKVYIGGSFSSFNGVPRRGIARVNPNGRTDTSFDPGTGVNGTVYAIALQRDGKILIGGEFTSVAGVPRINIARLNADGSMDTSFNAGLGANGSVRAIAIQFDDRIVIGGLFDTVSEVDRGHIARLEQDGTLDATFNPGIGANGAVYVIALQLDGKILAGGDFTSFNNVPENRIVRLNENGMIDPSVNFGEGANGFVAAMAIQTNRSIVLGGGFTMVDGLPRNRFARVYGGSIKGVGEIEFSMADFEAFENETNAVVTVIRSGGLLGTVTVDYATSSGTALATTDYLDVSGTLIFLPGENQKTFTVPLVNDNQAEPVEFINLSLTNATGGATLIRQPVARLNIISDDSSVGFNEVTYNVNESAPGGRALITLRRDGQTASPISVELQTVGGTATPGSDYQSISTIVTFQPGEVIKAVPLPIFEDNEVEDNEEVLLNLEFLGATVPGRKSATLVIFDNDFAPGILNLVQSQGVTESSGTMAIVVERVSGRTGAVTVDYEITDITATSEEDYRPSSGRLTFLEGETTKSIVVPVLDDSIVEGNEFFEVRLFAPTGGAQLGTDVIQVPVVDDDLGPGSFDTSFNIGSGASGPVRSMFLQPDGKIVLAGDFNSFNGFGLSGVARLHPTGAIDTEFNPGQGTDGPVYSVGRHTNGNLIIGGDFTTFGSMNRSFVGRLLTNGFADPNFNRSAGENNDVLSVASQNDGKIVIGGEFTVPARRILRLNANGSLDVSFNPDTGTDDTVRRVRIQQDGRVLIGGDFTQVGMAGIRGIARLMPNGLVDSSFVIGTGVNGTVHAITIAPDGKIYIGGDFSSINGTGRSRIARLNADGTVDLTFAPNASPNGPVYDIAVQGGKVYLGGQFTALGASGRNNVARLNTDGTLDSEFDPGLGPDGPVFAIAVENSGQILVAGDFLSVNGFFSPGIGRLNGDMAPPLDEVRIQFARVEGDSLVFMFGSAIGATYVIEGTADLQTWEPVDTVVATAATTEFRESLNSTHRFFRVRVQ